MKVQVIGGGILGCSAALALAGRNHQVTLVERGRLASESTAKAAGILSTMSWNEHDVRLIQETRGMVGELVSLALAGGHRAAKGAWRKAESIVIAGPRQAKTLETMQSLAEHVGEEPELFEGRQAARDFPGLRFEPGELALVAQEDGVIEAGDLFVAMRARLEDEGVTIRENQAAASTARGDFDAVVVAGGSWTKGLLERNGIPFPGLAYRTQLCSLGLEGAGALPIVHDLVRHFYTRPESEHSFLAGNGTQLRSFDPDDYNQAGDPEFVESIAHRVVERFTDGAEATVRRSWAGLCVATPDRHPLCGPVPGQPGLFVLSGDNGFALMRGLALGERLADAVAGKVDPVLDPARFGWPPPKEFVMQEGYGQA